MAVLTAKGISRVAIELLARQLVLPRTVTMVPGEEFRGSNGDTVTIRVPQPATGLEQASPGAALTAADVDEVPVDIQVRHQYHLKNITDQERSMSLENFARQVTLPQVRSVAARAEQKLYDVINALPATDPAINWDATSTQADDLDTILRARERLNSFNVPFDDRFLAVASDIATRLLKHDIIARADASGSADALRNAIIGRLYGFNIVEAPGLNAGTGIAYHRSGLAFATFAPLPPQGAADSASISDQGLALRQVFQYNASTASDQSLVSLFAGAAAVEDVAGGGPDRRFVKIATGT